MVVNVSLAVMSVGSLAIRLKAAFRAERESVWRALRLSTRIFVVCGGASGIGIPNWSRAVVWALAILPRMSRAAKQADVMVVFMVRINCVVCVCTWCVSQKIYILGVQKIAVFVSGNPVKDRVLR